MYMYMSIRWKKKVVFIRKANEENLVLKNPYAQNIYSLAHFFPLREY